VSALKLLFISFLLLSSLANADIIFHGTNGKVQTNLPDLAKRLKSHEIKVLEPHNLENRIYLAYSTANLFDVMFGKEWRQADEILMTCRDGYQPAVPVQRLLNKKAYLAFGLKDSEVFQVINKKQAHEKVELGPLYLVWDNLNDKEVLKDGATYWPYQIVEFAFIKFSEKFPKLSPPKGSSKQVQSGFNLFRKHCMNCHAINGEGGQVSHVDLNHPVNVTEYFKESWLEVWIKDPKSMRPKTPMPGLPEGLENKAQVAKDIIAYLKSKNGK
jgi:cytochrome c2